MNILEISYARTTGIERDNDGRLTLKLQDSVVNHLGTLHAGAQYTLAESASAECLLETFPELVGKVVPVLRSSQVRYRHPAGAAVHARASIIDESQQNFIRQFERKGRGAVSIEVA